MSASVGATAVGPVMLALTADRFGRDDHALVGFSVTALVLAALSLWLACPPSPRPRSPSPASAP